MLANAVLRGAGMAEFDPPPFFWLQGIVGLGALLTATVVLAKQNRFAKLAEQRELLDLKVTLLTEQKAAKLIDDTGIKAMDEEVQAEVADSLKFAEESPDPDASELWTDVYAGSN